MLLDHIEIVRDSLYFNLSKSLLSLEVFKEEVVCSHESIDGIRQKKRMNSVNFAIIDLSLILKANMLHNYTYN